MRITQSMIFRMGMEQLSAQRTRLARTQEMASSGRRINRPSDDPSDYQTLVIMKDTLQRNEQFLRTVDVARDRQLRTETALDESAQTVSQVRVETLAAINLENFQSNATREALKSNIEGAFEQILSLANQRSSSGAYLFSGRSSDRPAFTVAGAFGSGSVPTASFTGDGTTLQLEIDDGVFVDGGWSGQTVFQGSDDVFTVLSDLWTAIDQGDRATIQGSLDRIDVVFDHLVQQRTVLGGEGARVDAAEERLLFEEERLLTRVSALEDADAFEVFSNLVNQETALQASLSVTSRLIQPTLLDYI